MRENARNFGEVKTEMTALKANAAKTRGLAAHVLDRVAQGGT